MPRFSQTIRDPKTGATVIVCGRRDRKPCSTPGCTGDATVQCDFPVYRANGIGIPGSARRPNATCDRYVCRRCAVNVGKDRDYCPPHARRTRVEK